MDAHRQIKAGQHTAPCEPRDRRLRRTQGLSDVILPPTTVLDPCRKAVHVAAIRHRYISVKEGIRLTYLLGMPLMCDIIPMNNIAKIRRARGFSQEQLAVKVGLRQPHISRIEKGDEGVSLRVLNQIAEALEVSVADLFLPDRSELETALLNAFRQLPQDRQQGWIDMARMLLQDQQRHN